MGIRTKNTIKELLSHIIVKISATIIDTLVIFAILNFAIFSFNIDYTLTFLQALSIRLILALLKFFKKYIFNIKVV